ncbi:4-hydroxythreonine-4-phosphate dehydrogenase PdxA [Luteitalea sp.]|jgi:4-hydroxythreonine-4-phosphate dehydrogenase|uniref:4-hydroxythreonine-4-phosphate dehydrogenase PdxA n=1 Tax=Luteitalea sp. TaxID=2004800 RepID=UPI0037CC12B7
MISSRRVRDAGPKPRVAITVGDPAGIGPEIALAAAASREVRAVCEPVLYGPHTTEALAAFTAGQVSAAAGQASYDAVVDAVRDAQAGLVQAIATGPVHKEAFAACGLPWKGHTDLLGHLTGSPQVAMMFHSEPLRVVLATVHVPLADVPRLLTRDLVESIVTLTARSLPAFGYATPRIGLAGLNPHAGEHGLMGHEDDDVLAPAVAACRARGIDVQGPFPGDTVFLRATRGAFDVVVACYHDQGLIPVKLLAFGQSVNVTLGLPIIRTSVDHGTAFDIARQGTADASSMVSAVTLAARLAAARH